MEIPKKISLKSVESVNATVSQEINPVLEEDKHDSQITVKKSLSKTVDKQKENVSKKENIPDITPRPRPEGESENPHTIHEVKNFNTPSEVFIDPKDLNRDVEIVSQIPNIDTTLRLPDLNVYQNKKTLAQGMMDLALFSANANQLRYVLESSGRHPYYYPSIVFISVSLLMQVNKAFKFCFILLIKNFYFAGCCRSWTSVECHLQRPRSERNMHSQ